MNWGRERRTKLPNVHHVVLVLQHGRLVVVDIQVIGRAEDGHDARKPRCSRLAIHPISRVLGFMRTDDGEQVVLLEEGACGRVGEEVGASSDVIMHEILGRLLLTEIFERIGPEDVAHQPVRGRLSESINLVRLVVRRFEEC